MSGKKSKRVKNRLKYWFDNQMSAGTIALIRMLIMVTLILIVVVGVIIMYMNKEANIFKSMWLSLNYIIDPGNMGATEGGYNYLMLVLIATLIGLMITSTLIGIISNAISVKIQDLQRGKSIVVEKNHVVVLGTASGLYTIVEQLIEANANHRKETVVIMDDKETKEVMDEKFRERFPDTGSTNIVCRCGCITDVASLDVCSIDTCKSIIINAENDSVTIKSILATAKLIKKYNNLSAHIVAVIRNKANVEAAEVAGEGFVEIFSFKDTISRIIAHTSRNTGLSKIFTGFFSFQGSEIYVEDCPKAVGKTMGEINLYFPKSVAIGIQSADGGIYINPETTRVIEKDDKLIMFAEDDGVSIPNDKPGSVEEKYILKEYVEPVAKRKNILLLGYSEKIPRILMEEDKYLGEGSVITIAVEPGQENMLNKINSLNLSNLKIDVVVCDIYDRDTLEELIEDKAAVVVLSDYIEDMSAYEEEKKDAKIILLLLQLKYLSALKNIKLNVTSEMLRVENEELAQITEVNDFVISSNLTSLMMTQVSQTRGLKKIFEELLSSEGSNIYMRPAKDYIVVNREVDIYTASEAATRRREILIGYRTYDEVTRRFEVVANPPKDTKVFWGEKDAFVIIAQD